MSQYVASESRSQNESTAPGAQTIIHAPGTFFLQFRQDFVALCATCGYTKSTETKKSRSSPWCKAFILSIIEQFAPSKNGGPVTMTLCQWMERMYGLFGRNTIIDSLDELVGETLIRRKAYKAKTGEVYGYWLNYSLINERLAILGDQLKMKPSSLEGVENETGVVSNETGGSFKFNLEGLKMKHIVYSNVYSNLDSEKRVSRVSAFAENATPSPAFSSSGFSPWDDQDEEDQQETLQTLQAAGIVPTQPNQQQEAASHPIATETPSLANAQEQKAPSQEPMANSEPALQAETPSQQPLIPAQPSSPDVQAPDLTFTPVVHYSSEPEWQEAKADYLETLRASWDAMTPAERKALRWKDHKDTQAALWLKSHPKPQVAPRERAMRKELQQKINEWRGYSLDDEGQKIRESTAIIPLARRLLLWEQGDHEGGYTMDELKFTLEQVKIKDSFWKDPKNSRRAGAIAIGQKAAEYIHAQRALTAGGNNITEITTGHASNRYAQASLPGGKPSWMMTDEEIDALPTPLERKAARISKRNRLEFDRQQQEQSAPFAIAR